MPMKYIMFQTPGEGFETPVIFLDTVKHSEIASAMNSQKGMKAVSAGTIAVNSHDDDIQVSCYGDSSSLGLVSRPTDAGAIKRALGYGW